MKSIRRITIILPTVLLLFACEYTEEDPIPSDIHIQDALAVFSDDTQSLKKITFDGSVETVALNDVQGDEMELHSTFPTVGRSNLLYVNINYYDYAVHRASGKAIPFDGYTSLDGHNDTSIFTSYANANDYERNDIQTINDRYAFRITDHKSNTVELQSAHFTSDGQLKSSPVLGSKHVTHFMLSDSGLLAYTTRDISGSGLCTTHITSGTGGKRIEHDPGVFYWKGASGDLYYLASSTSVSSLNDINRVNADETLSTELVGHSTDNIEGPCERDIQWIGTIENRSYYLRLWVNDLIEFNEDTMSFRVLDVLPDRGLVGAGVAGDYIYYWGEFTQYDEPDRFTVSAVDQLDPISEVTTRIYTGDPVLVGYIDNDTLWAHMSTPGLHSWVGKIDNLSTLTGPTSITEVYRPTGTFDGGLTFNYVWLGR
ncbi:hypothetical protein [Saccharospirillum salsuginis]|uniref:DUF4374 domain-containing protein n=1 Tax=Saccharospirillum salsuginis TaxID=418750 RepID=A0A918KNK2_9GAMM|nr:hypothetical protein [Saccharospirillum salsuginis]GGX69144.1 hypothetical protein GCM10007392_41070 [Saccharospirillum salsuginis]